MSKKIRDEKDNEIAYAISVIYFSTWYILDGFCLMTPDSRGPYGIKKEKAILALSHCF